MAQPRQQRRRGGGLHLLAVLLVLLSLCLARLDAAPAASSAASPEWKEGAANALEKAVGQEAARGLAAAPEEEGPAVAERVAMEVINDYPQTGANNRHNPHP